MAAVNAHATGTRELDRLGGLLRRMPAMALLFLVGAVAICGLQPLNGFVSEVIIYAGLLSGSAPSSQGNVAFVAAAAALAFSWISLTLPPAVVLAAIAEPSAAAITGASFALGASAAVFGIQLATARHLRA